MDLCRNNVGYKYRFHNSLQRLIHAFLLIENNIFVLFISRKPAIKYPHTEQAPFLRHRQRKIGISCFT